MTKVVLFDRAGHEAAGRTPPQPDPLPAPGHTERDPEGMWRDVGDAVRELLADQGVDAGEIAAVSVSGYGAGLYLVDRQGKAVRPWRDVDRRPRRRRAGALGA